jgi:hypothetical protein
MKPRLWFIMVILILTAAGLLASVVVRVQENAETPVAPLHGGLQWKKL